MRVSGVDFDPDRAVVGTRGLGVNEGALQPGAEGRRRQEIVDAPADVARPRAARDAPPGVMPRAALELAEGVEKACLDERLEAGAFLRGESVRADVLFGPREVDLLVGDVEVAAEYHRLALFETEQVGEKCEVPALAVRAGARDRFSSWARTR